jgi:serine phosphatase RsbU (regulator of sigma subunit)
MSVNLLLKRKIDFNEKINAVQGFVLVSLILAPFIIILATWLINIGYPIPVLAIVILAFVETASALSHWLASKRIKSELSASIATWTHSLITTVVETLAIFFSGGISSPFIWLYALSISIEAIYLSPLKAIFIALIDSALLFSVSTLTFFKIFSQKYSIIRGINPYTLGLPYILAQTGIYIFFFLTVAILTGFVSERLHRQRKQIEEKAESLEVLYNAVETATSALALPNILRIFSREICRTFNLSRLSIFLYNEDTGRLIGFTGFGIDEKELRAATHDLADFPIALKAIKTGKPQIVEDAAIEAAIPSECIVKLGIKSLFCAPLKVRGKTVGIILADKGGAPFDISSDRLAVGTALLKQTAIALENVKRYQERVLFDSLQKSILPEKIPSLPNLEIGCCYESATVEVGVGGDFYDFLSFNEGKFAVVIGDVCGRGVEAAADVIKIKYFLQALLREKLRPAETLKRLNSIVFKEMPVGKFITMIIAVCDLNSSELIYANAGHPHPLCYQTVTRSYIWLDKFGPALGIKDKVEYPENRIRIKEKQLVILYTDGLIENRINGRMFGEVGLLEAVKNWVLLPPTQLASEVVNDCLRFSQHQLHDDIALVVLRKK